MAWPDGPGDGKSRVAGLVDTVSNEFELRLRRLEDERAIVATLHRYGHSIDYGDEARFLDCFTDDGVFDVHWQGGESVMTLYGRGELEQFISRHSRSPEGRHKHVVVEPLITVDGDAAQCSAYFFLLHDVGDEPVLRMFGRYTDTLARGADGRWRFTVRRADVESRREGLPAVMGVHQPRRSGSS